MEKSDLAFDPDATGSGSGDARLKGVVLPAHCRLVFDPAELFGERIRDQLIVYLDTNMWIELRDQKTEDARTCRAYCERAVEQGQVVFPVSYASVSEVLESPSAEARIAQAGLMDALSLGVTFRNPVVVYALEGHSAYRYVFLGESVPPRRCEIFTSMPDYLGDESMQFPEGWRSADVENFLAFVRADPSYRSLRWLIQHMDLDQLRRKHASMNNYAARFAAQVLARDASLTEQRLTRDRAIHEERLYLFEQYVVPAIRRALLAQGGERRALDRIQEFWDKHGGGSRQRFARMFRTAAPSLELSAQLHARRSLDSHRKPEPQDFWDMEHASLAPVYADAFVTLDRGLADLLRSKGRMPPAAKADVLTSLRALTEWLRS